MLSIIRRLVGRQSVSEQARDLATEKDLYDCYRLLLRREPDDAGWAHWTNWLRQPRPLRDLWQGFVDSTELRNLDGQSSQLGKKAGRYQCVDTGDYRIYVDVRDQLVGAAIVSGAFEPHVTHYLRGLLRPRATFLDLGANVGYFSLLAASLVGPHGKVIAFEPRPDNVALLTLSLRENGFGNVDVHPLAAAEAALSFKVYPDATSSLSHVVEADREVDHPLPAHVVRAVALDEFLSDLPRLDVVKADVDGNEFRAFRGLRRLIQRHRPVIVFEFAPALLADVGQIVPEALLEEVMGHGYDVFVLTQGNDREGGPRTVEQILTAHARSKSTHLDLVAYPT
ncbi:MAG: FkbM family methyltransferase [Gemmataceae bacterium]